MVITTQASCYVNSGIDLDLDLETWTSSTAVNILNRDFQRLCNMNALLVLISVFLLVTARPEPVPELLPATPEP
ncbi:unnamed protein product [Colias eurytheme]|nr:unnamed protein product [Colias eurytheme]